MDDENYFFHIDENIESDKLSTDPKITTLLKIADALEITINDLYL